MIPAHDPVAPGELWSSWHPDPLVLAGLALAAVVYRQGLVGLRRQRRGRPAVGPTQVAAFSGGLATLAVALASPLEAAASSLFAAHMVQHLMLLVVAPPLLVLGRPGLVMTMALPRRARRRVRRAGTRGAVRRTVEAVSHPAAVWGAGTVVLWAWHLPSLYEAAVLHDAVHALEHATLLAIAGLLWAAVLGRGSRPLAAPAVVLLLFVTALQGAALGAVLSLASAPLYAVHEPVAPLWGLTPLEDQQLAGGLMWVPPGLVYLAVMAGVLVRWFASLDARSGDAASSGDLAVDEPVRTIAKEAS